MQAEQFNDAIQIVRNWLPEAEAELKLHSVPDDEESIMHAIHNHEVRQWFTWKKDNIGVNSGDNT